MNIAVDLALIDVDDLCTLEETIAHARAEDTLRPVLLQGGQPRPDPSRLSPREHQIVYLIAVGLTNKEIGQRLTVAEKTVKNHISKIFAKRRVATRRQLIFNAMEAGII